ncbi:transcriptional regulator NrdR [Hyphobacterium marinum]|uniref:Transcriptional repressor NrdR n=1 Tax=Hyphobacterium marinum TaxID=3116574 RepID=A0ABU7LYP3_9PROT|nr:transcriptional regulator NrdR [Hyphobacterium sp. Y6023]MEE2566676.1 transcriptional regulator NrdR [Hyphobacterium sp. Y6023]
MRCPFCNHDDTQVKDSRPAEDGAAIRRRRQCPACAARFTTFERVQLRELTVMKKSGRRAPFDRDKMTRSVMLACQKRNIDPDKIEQAISGIIRRLESSGDAEIESGRIGQLIMDALKNLDQVAYVRYASVYKDFREVEDFREFIKDERLGPKGEVIPPSGE